MAIDALGLCLDEDVILVGRHLVAVYACQMEVSFHIVHVKENACLFSSMETLAHNLLVVVAELAVGLSVVQRVHSIDTSCIVCPVAEVVQLQVICCHVQADSAE